MKNEKVVFNEMIKYVKNTPFNKDELKSLSKKLKAYPSDSFVKADNGKLQWSLMPFEQLEDVVKVLMNGAKKHSVDNWKKCNDIKRYEDALMWLPILKVIRLIQRIISRTLHMQFVTAFFLMWFDKKKCN